MTASPNISLLQLRAFLAVSRYGSFTRAAEVLHRTQPAITQQIRSLEESLGLKLFDRTTRHLRLTEAAADLVPVLSAMLKQLDDVVDATQDLRHKRRGTVRLGCLPSVAALYLPGRVAEFRRHYPGVSFVVSDGLGDQVVGMVKRGEVDFGITDVQQPAHDLRIRPLLRETIQILYLDGHPIAQAPCIDVDELSRHDLILTAPGSTVRRIVDTAFAAQGRVAIATCQASYNTTAIGMVQAGLGVALLPASGFDLDQDRRLRTRAIEAPGFDRELCMIQLKDRCMPPATQAFLAMLEAETGLQSLRDAVPAWSATLPG
ncbi:LysR family transcriptional regulator [Bordetella sp. 15P40C-2]|uniref:LysR family transcriptional regulator n=1 Tax=Bordetella sp. 15P40C-2 TaxID=2572246 RepID=UPI001322224B|nr:LysR family transcriptional regulator [Bordetella sp. 15P40C-2]MVW71165.1 LysR family transcriptional regulator [Bordetella sp. 15P40C-2]